MDKLITVVGATACSKSGLGIYLARKFNGEIVSCDSRQIYKGLDLGTGKVTPHEQSLAVHHLLDIKNPNEKFSLAEYQKCAYKSINDILSRKKTPFLVGGTGLYSRAVVEGYNFFEEPENDESIEIRAEINSLSREELENELKNAGIEVPPGLSPRHLQRRVEKMHKGIEECENRSLYDYLQLICVYPREELYRRIETRLDDRINQGMVEEVANLRKCGATDEFLDGLGLEYRYTLRYLRGEYEFNEYREELLKQIRHFAKRQITWFKKEKNAVWLDMTGDFEKQASDICEKFLAEND